MDEDDDKVTTLADGDRTRTFSPSRRPSFQPWTRANTTTAATGFQRTSSAEPLLRRQRSRQVCAIRSLRSATYIVDH